MYESITMKNKEIIEEQLKEEGILERRVFGNAINEALFELERSTGKKRMSYEVLEFSLERNKKTKFGEKLLKATLVLRIDLEINKIIIAYSYDDDGYLIEIN